MKTSIDVRSAALVAVRFMLSVVARLDRSCRHQSNAYRNSRVVELASRRLEIFSSSLLTRPLQIRFKLEIEILQATQILSR